MKNILAAVLIATLIAACGEGAMVRTGITVAYQDEVTGEVKFRPLMRPAQPGEIDAMIPRSICPKKGC